MLEDTYKIRSHLLKFGDEIRKEFRHVLLLSGIQRLVVHCVDFAEAEWIVGFSLALQKICEHLLQFHQSSLISIVARALEKINKNASKELPVGVYANA